MEFSRLHMLMSEGLDHDMWAVKFDGTLSMARSIEKDGAVLALGDKSINRQVKVSDMQFLVYSWLCWFCE
jgi:hypothetical protein